MIKMKFLILCFSILSVELAMINPLLEYKKLPVDAKASEWISKKVSFEGRFSDIPAQHMFASPSAVPHNQSFYIDPAPEYRYINQMVGYYNGKVLLDKNIYKGYRIRFYGEFILIEGETKKGGGQHWSEWGFIIHEVEGLWDKNNKW